VNYSKWKDAAEIIGVAAIVASGVEGNSFDPHDRITACLSALDED